MPREAAPKGLAPQELGLDERSEKGSFFTPLLIILLNPAEYYAAPTR